MFGLSPRSHIGNSSHTHGCIDTTQVELAAIFLLFIKELNLTYYGSFILQLLLHGTTIQKSEVIIVDFKIIVVDFKIIMIS